jgi:PIN domain nuclease of toxin-antitoxin system
MRLLLDTSALLWALAGDRRLGKARTAVADRRNRVFVSAASAWEIAIKVGLGKLQVPPDVTSWLPSELAAAQMTPLPIVLDHACAVENLPRHHTDPFDRLLIAQALHEDLMIVTGDAQFSRYGVRVLLC